MLASPNSFGSVFNDMFKNYCNIRAYTLSQPVFYSCMAAVNTVPGKLSFLHLDNLSITCLHFLCVVVLVIHGEPSAWFKAQENQCVHNSAYIYSREVCISMWMELLLWGGMGARVGVWGKCLWWWSRQQLILPRQLEGGGGGHASPVLPLTVAKDHSLCCSTTLHQDFHVNRYF